MIEFLWNEFKNHKMSLAAIALCAVLTAGMNLLEPFITAKFIDEILIGRDIATFYYFITIFLTISILAIITNWFSTIISSKVRLKINNRIIENVMRHVYKIRGDFILKTDMVYLSKRLDQDVIDLVYFAIGSMTDICINFALLLMAMFLLGSIGIKWLALFVIIALIHGIGYRMLKKILFERSTAVRETDSKYFTCISDILLYAYSIKLHSIFDIWLEKFHAAFEKNFVAVMNQVKIIFWFSTSSVNANAFFKVLLFLLGGLDVLNGNMSIGNFVALNGYYLLAMQSVSYFMNIGQSYQNAFAAYTRIIEIKNLPEELRGEKILTRIDSINVENISFDFNEQKIFKDFSAQFQRGKIYCIVGKNGAGKSTLINLICGMLKPVKGTIKFNEIDIDKIDMIHCRKNLISVVEQKHLLKNDTLSGGERKKLTVATAFEKSADVLIMDEPDNNMDSIGLTKLIQQLQADKKNRITIIISHDNRIIDAADEIINL